MAWLDHLRLVSHDAEQGLWTVSIVAEAIDEGLVGFVTPERLEALGRALGARSGRRSRVELAASAGGTGSSAGGASPQAELRRKAGELPLVRAVLDAFPGAEVVEVRPAEPAGGHAEGDAG